MVRPRTIASTTLTCALAVVAATGCRSDDDPGVADDPPGVTTEVGDGGAAGDPLGTSAITAAIEPAIGAVEAELGEGQEFFEVTSTAAGFVNLFVATDDGTTAVPYLFFDGELESPAPAQEGASGNTFTADDVDIDPDSILDRLSSELPSTTVEAFSVYGDGFGAVYVVAGRSEAGGLLDIVVGPDGSILSVDPL